MSRKPKHKIGELVGWVPLAGERRLIGEIVEIARMDGERVIHGGSAGRWVYWVKWFHASHHYPLGYTQSEITNLKKHYRRLRAEELCDGTPNR